MAENSGVKKGLNYRILRVANFSTAIITKNIKKKSEQLFFF